MIKAKQDERELVKDLLSQSFKENQSINYIIKKDKKQLRSIRALMDYSIGMCSLFGDVWITDDGLIHACSISFWKNLERK